MNSLDSLRWSVHLTLFYGTNILQRDIINLLFLPGQYPLYFNYKRANYIILWYTVAVELIKYSFNNILITARPCCLYEGLSCLLTDLQIFLSYEADT